MVIFAIFFALGVWLLQQQAALPDFGWVWLLLGFPLLHPLSRWRDRVRVRVVERENNFQHLIVRSIHTLLLAAFAFGLGFYHAAWQAEQRLAVALPDEWQGRDIEVIGVVAGLPRSHEHGQRFNFDVEQILTPQASVPEHIYLSTYYEKLLSRRRFDKQTKPLALKAGERWRLTLRLKQPHGTANPHIFDFEAWALENNLRAVGYVHPKGKNMRLDALADGLAYRIETWREAVRDKFNATLGGEPYAGVLSALAIGDQSGIPSAQWQVFTRTGVNHLMSISGLHITMLASLGFSISYWLWRRSVRLTLLLPARKAAALAALLVALGYALLSGFAVPAQRTVYMVGAVAAALWLNRNFSLGQILGIALLGVLIPDPWAVISPGFWLSFGAVALILYVSAYRLGQPHWLMQYASVQWAMTIGLIPLLLGLFQQVSLVSPVANALAIPLVSLIVVPLALLGAALPPDFSNWDAPLWLAHSVMSGVMVFLEWLNALPQAVWTQHVPPAWSIVAGMLGVLLILLPRGFPARWLGLPMLLPMFLNTPEPPAPGTLRLIIFDAGQGLAVAAQTRHHTLLYDAGPDFSDDADSGNRILIPALRAMGINQLDGLMLTHDDSDHTGGAASVMQGMPTGWLSSSLPDEHWLVRQAALSPDPSPTRSPSPQSSPARGRGGEREKQSLTLRCMDGQSWQWDGVSFEMLHPDATSYAAAKIRDNNRGCVLRISTGDQHILLTADIEKESEQRLLIEHADKLPATLLVVPHHGSKTSSTDGFISAVSPNYAVFTVGYRNRFGHPKQEVVQRYAASGAQLLRSDEDGAILVEMNAQGVQVESYRKSHRRYWMHSP
ncbi:MAG: DNA internalization-related competence protein ComEC/Rec2 [Gallionella sp.]|nr:DNA internalization-related competence protein ComEC/Rec2 [Gallionella sp.]